MALALERIGWSNAEFWTRRQAQYDLAQECRRSVGSLTDSNGNRPGGRYVQSPPLR